MLLFLRCHQPNEKGGKFVVFCLLLFCIVMADFDIVMADFDREIMCDEVDVASGASKSGIVCAERPNSHKSGRAGRRRKSKRSNASVPSSGSAVYHPNDSIDVTACVQNLSLFDKPRRVFDQVDTGKVVEVVPLPARFPGNRKRKPKLPPAVVVETAQSPVVELEKVVRKKNNRRRRGNPFIYKGANGVVGDIRVGANQTRTGRPNPADPRFNRLVASLGNTKEGRAFVVKHLHPNGEGYVQPTRTPDGEYTNSVIMERRDDFTLSAPDAVAEKEWDCIIVNTPFLRFPVWVIAYDSSLKPTDDDFGRCFQSNCYDFENQTEWYKMDGTSVEMYTKTVQMTLWDTAGGDGTTLHPNAYQQRFRSVRQTSCGLTADFIYNAVTSKGVVYAGQWDSNHTQEVGMYDPDGGANKLPHPMIAFEMPPVNSSAMVQSDPLFYKAPATDGCYLPMRAKSFEGTTSASYYKIAFKSGNTFLPLPNDSLKGLNYILVGAKFGVIHYAAIHGSSSISVKRQETLEFTTAAESDYSPFSEPAASKDDKALTVISEFSRNEKHAYPADFNKKDLMIGNILSGLGQALGKLNIPIVSQIAPIAGDLVGGLLNHFFG